MAVWSVPPTGVENLVPVRGHPEKTDWRTLTSASSRITLSVGLDPPGASSAWIRI